MCICFRHKKTILVDGFFNYGAPGRIRTSDRSVRSRVLYPAELQAHICRGRELWGIQFLTSMAIVINFR